MGQSLESKNQYEDLLIEKISHDNEISLLKDLHADVEL